MLKIISESQIHDSAVDSGITQSLCSSFAAFCISPPVKSSSADTELPEPTQDMITDWNTPLCIHTHTHTEWRFMEVLCSRTNGTLCRREGGRRTGPQEEEENLTYRSLNVNRTLRLSFFYFHCFFYKMNKLYVFLLFSVALLEFVLQRSSAAVFVS